MCVAIPGKIIEINGMKAIAEMLSIKREISIGLLDSVNVGDYVIIHAGAAISLIDEEEAKKTIEIFELLGETNNE